VYTVQSLYSTVFYTPRVWKEPGVPEGFFATTFLKEKIAGFLPVSMLAEDIKKLTY
jgi:hypothetical protein